MILLYSRDIIFTKQNVLLVILVTTLLLRLFDVGSIPSSLNSDELLKAYDGASVWLTGKDHHGSWFPLFFEQSGEYSPPLYIYFSGLFSSCFGIGPVMVRLPSVLLGYVSVLFTLYFLRRISTEKTALVAAALVAVSPWHIFYSRIGWEAVLQVPMQLIAFLFLEKWVNDNAFKSLIISTTAFALTLYAYPTERLFIPLMLLWICMVYYKQIIQQYKQVILCLGWFVILMLPTINMYINHQQQMQARWQFLSVFHLTDGWLVFFTQWLEHLSPMFLFITGSYFGMIGGVALLVILPFFYLGLWTCVRRHNKSDLILLGWFLLFSVPASMTYDRYDSSSMPNSLRTTCGMPVIEIISAYGIMACYDWIKQEDVKKYFFYGIALLIIPNAAYVYYDYSKHYSNRVIESSQFNFQLLVKFIETFKYDYDKVIISHKIGLHPISVAAFSKESPEPFSHEDYPKYVLPFYHYVPTYHDWGTDEYNRFGTINRWFYQGEGKLLIVAKAGEIWDEKPIFTIGYPNGEPAYEFYAVER